MAIDSSRAGPPDESVNSSSVTPRGRKSSVTARGKKSVAIGGNANGATIITGDMLFNLFAQAPRALSSYIRVARFQTLIRERTRAFVGREFVFTAIDELMGRDHFPSGYIMVVGEPGIGKTALLGQLVQRRGYVHHFNIAGEGIRSYVDFLRNVCAQLIVRRRLDYSAFPREAEEDNGFLSQLLAEAAVTCSQKSPLVILVDALDEAEDTGLPSRANKLYLPGALPDHVYFVITTRPKEDYRLRVDRQEFIYLNDNDPRNLADVGDYVRQYVKTQSVEMSNRLDEWGVNADEFVTILTEKSEGNFLYIVYMLRDIATGRVTRANIDDIHQLPQGLTNYYREHWRVMREQAASRFDNYYKPIVCLLATVREPVSVGQLGEWTDLAPFDIKDVISTWLEFLNCHEAAGGEPAYRVYHASFFDFLNKEIGLGPWHKKIAQTALAKIPGVTI